MDGSELSRYLPEIVNTMSEGLFCARPDGRIVLVNEALTRITGYGREELLNQPCRILGCDACEQSRAAGGRAHCKLFLEKVENRKNCRLRRKDGSLVHVLKNACLLKDAQGRVIGAVETLTDITELDLKERRIRQLARNLEAGSDFHGMIGQTQVMRELYNLLEKAARTEAPVLLLGESGTGKEIFSRAIHKLSQRHAGPFVAVNCGALPEQLMESELFGYKTGAFTDARKDKPGRFALAEGGTLFLDEIGDLPYAMQAKILRALQERAFEPLGGVETIPADVRVVAATNRDLGRMVAEGAFRQDLYYRLSVVVIRIPPLRERLDDVPLLTERLLGRCRMAVSKNIETVSPEAMARLMAHDYPGNIRELENIIEYAAIICLGKTIELCHLPEHLRGEVSACPVRGARTMAEIREQAAREAVERQGGNRNAACRELGISKDTLRRILGRRDEDD